MKFPPYISDNERELTRKLYLQVRKKQGIEQASIFKKLALVAAYGEMYQGKIDYSEFITVIEKRIKNNVLVSDFWDLRIDAERNSPSDMVYHIKEKSIVFNKPKDLEKEIIITLKKHYPYAIRENKRKYCEKIIEDYDQ